MASTTTEPAPGEADSGDRFPQPKPAYRLNLRVFIPAAAIILVLVALALIVPAGFSTVISAINSVVVDGIGWYYVLVVTVFVAFVLALAFSRFGDIKLGKDEDEPEYSVTAWFAMLFAAGMGIGLVFWGAAEPLNHLMTPPPNAVDASDAVQGQRALTQTFLHWGVHAWAIYAVVGLAVGYAVHRRGRPVSIRWALEPILGRWTNTVIGDIIDVAAIVGTLFGVATSLGFGVNQMTAGLVHLGVLDALGLGEYAGPVKIALVIGITVLATISVMTGLDKGIKILSNLNMGLAAIFLVAILILGPTLFLFREFVAGIGNYLQNFLVLAFQTFPFYRGPAEEGANGASWLSGWTTYYWGWWISWSPFVGIFIARISKGRTVRQFVVGVLLVPTLITTLWFSILGGTAIFEQLFGDGVVGEEGVNNDTALFETLTHLPAGQLLAGIAVILVMIFFITSSDSGSFVVDMISHSGNPNPPVWSRVFWAGLEGLIAASLIGASLVVGTDDTGGMAALQALTIIAAAPFSVAMIGMCVSLAKVLARDHRRIKEAEDALVRREMTHHVASTLEVETAPPNKQRFPLRFRKSKDSEPERQEIRNSEDLR